ncbi:MAG: sulfatase [Puniceicoccaceae bacterium]
MKKLMNQTCRLAHCLKGAFLLFGLFVALLGSIHAGERPNILMIVVDDLKPNIGSFGDAQAITPALDKLSARGTVFLNSHCQQAVCGASRASALTGLRPDTVQVWDFQSRMRDALPDLVTLPQYFKNSGYHTASIGKIFDFRCCDGRETNDVASWSQPHTTMHAPHLAKSYYGDPETIRRLEEGESKARAAGKTTQGEIRQFTQFFPTTECLPENVPDNFYEDGMRTDHAVDLMKDLAASDNPFFLAVGYKKPHLPFVAPKKYWDIYDPQDLSLAAYQQMPEGAPEYHFQDSWELRGGYAPIPEGRLPDAMQRHMIHGYYACVSYIDKQVEKLMEALEENGISENTIVILWGDHGWHLGDHGMWCKHTNYEQATRSPLLIVDPRMAYQTRTTMKPVEFLDMAPTLAELAGLPVPEAFEGRSLVPLLECPDSNIKPFAVSQFARSQGAPNNLMGYAFRDEQHRLILWLKMDYKGGQRQGKLIDKELYDYAEDPLETRNLAVDPEHSDLLSEMMDAAAAFAAEQMTISWK